MIPFVDLSLQHREVLPDLEAALKRVLDSGRYVQGPEVAGFECDFAEYCGVEHAVGVNSGTSALHLSLLAAGVRPGDEVITVPFTFVATAAAIGYAGARPVFVDISPETYTLDPEKLEAAITERTRAIVPVHLFGQPADMDPILEIARRRNLRVIEDACQAHGARYKGKPVGSLGDLGCFSFYPSKNLGALGEGGAVVTSDPEAAKALRMLRDWGQEVRYRHVLRGFNYRMEEIQGAVLRVKLDRLESWNRRRRECALIYQNLLDGSGVKCPVTRAYGTHVFHLFVIRISRRDSCREGLKALDIETGVHYPEPIHLMRPYRDLGYSEGSFPIAEAAASEVLSLPMYPHLEPAQIEAVCRALRRVQESRGVRVSTPGGRVA